MIILTKIVCILSNNHADVAYARSAWF